MKKLNVLFISLFMGALIPSCNPADNSPDISIIAGLGLSNGIYRRDVIVVFSKEPGREEEAFIHNAGGKIIRKLRLIPAYAVRLPDGVLDLIRSHPGVAHVDDDEIIRAIDPVVGKAADAVVDGSASGETTEYENSWGVSRIGSYDVHTENITGAGVRISILDTGIDYSHPELADNYRGGDNFISLDPDNHDPFDDSYNSHGTHVAGIIAGTIDNHGVVGVAPDVDLYAVKVADGAGFSSVSAIIAGIEYSVENQVDIINISIGVPIYVQAFEEACIAAEQAGILIVAAAGNTYGGGVQYPALFNSVIAVGATGQDDGLSPVSATGPEIELVAPGVGIYSTIKNNTYGYLTGTSQASPHVAGVAALVMSTHYQDMNGDGLTDLNDVRLKLQRTALELGEDGRDTLFGFGMVSAGAASTNSSPMHFILESKKGCKRGTITRVLAGRKYSVTIENFDLCAVRVKVFIDGAYSKSLAETYTFRKHNDSTVTFSLDASVETLEVRFIPIGRPGAHAEVTIQ